MKRIIILLAIFLLPLLPLLPLQVFAAPMQGDGVSGSGVVTSSEGGNLAILNDAFSGKNLFHRPVMTATSGEDVAFDVDVSVLPGVATTLTAIGFRSRLNINDNNMPTGAGHTISGFFSTELKHTSGTHPLSIAGESWWQNAGGGGVNQGFGYFVHMGGNEGPVTNFTGFAAAFNLNNDTMGTAQGFNVSMEQGTGTTSNFVGYNVSDLNDGTGVITNAIGYSFAPQTDAITGVAFQNLNTTGQGFVDDCTIASTSGLTGCIQTDGGIGAAGNVVTNALLIANSASSTSDASAIPVTEQLAFVSTTTTGNKVMTLADGVEGQQIIIIGLAIHSTGPAVITPANAFLFTTITISAAGDTATIVFKSGVWIKQSSEGGVFG